MLIVASVSAVSACDGRQGTYEDFVHDNLFKPLRMNDSGMFSFVTVIPRRASGYWPGSNGIENADRSFDTRICFSSGSLYSTTEDLLRLGRWTVQWQAIDAHISSQNDYSL